MICPSDMKTLETEINYVSHTLRQIWRKNDIAVYARSLNPDERPHELELIFVQAVADKMMPDGELSPAHEAYPSPSKWGEKGFSFPIRYRDLVLKLAEECCEVSEGRRALVRERRASWPIL